MDVRCRTYEGIKLEICNLDLDIDQTVLYKEFSKYGVVLNIEIVEGSKHCPVKGANVTYYSPGEAQMAIRALNGKALLNNILYIGQARRKRSRSGQNGQKNNNINDNNNNHIPWNINPTKFLTNLQHSSSDLSSSWSSGDSQPNVSYGNSLIEFKKISNIGYFYSKSGSPAHNS